MVRDVRNKFAHRVEALNFDHPDIVAVMEKANRNKVVISENARNRFLLLFSFVAALLVVEQDDGIRLQEVSKTHPDIFSAVAEAIQQAAQTRPQKSTADRPTDTA